MEARVRARGPAGGSGAARRVVSGGTAPFRPASHALVRDLTPAPGGCDHSQVPTDSDAPRLEDATREEIEDGRILAAVAYLPALCFVGFAAAPTNRYVQFHARQGLLLFALEMAAWVGLWIVDVSIGTIPFLGLLVTAAARLAV